MKDNVSLILRIGLAFSFIYVAISAFLNPTNWIGFIPVFLDSIFSRELFLTTHIIFNLILGIWLLTNKKTYYAAIVSAVALFFITVFNLGALDIVFRDVSLFFMALALVFLSKK